jgi:hypothetical protein
LAKHEHSVELAGVNLAGRAVNYAAEIEIHACVPPGALHQLDRRLGLAIEVELVQVPLINPYSIPF